MFKLSLPKHSYLIVVLPTAVTLTRIFLAPFIVQDLLHHNFEQAFWLFLVAAATDTIDGNVARWFGAQSFIGACLDPLADKILLLSCFCSFYFMQSPVFHIPLWFFLLALSKDLILIAGFLYRCFKTGPDIIQPTLLAKCSTLIQILFIVWLFICYFFHYYPVMMYNLFLGFMTVTILATLLHYAYIAVVSKRNI
jgi:cardiolipin synthase (CMP-forming)